MKRIQVGKPTKTIGVLAAAAVVGLFAFGGVQAANAAEDDWVPQSTRTLYPVYDNEGNCYDGVPVLVEASTNVVEGESITNTLLNGNPLAGDAETRVGPGAHSYTYVVTNLNSTATPQESVTQSGSFTVVTCEEPADPSATLGPLTATPNDDGTTRSISVSGSVTLADIPEGATVTVVTTASSGATSTTTVTGSGPFSTTLTGSFPDGTVTVSSQTYVNGAAVGSSTGSSVVFTAPVDPQPEAPIVDAQLTGVLEDNKSAVHAVVTVDRNDAEGTLTVIISHGDSEEPDTTLEFPEGTETLRVTFPVDECGSIEFSVRFEDSLNSGQSYTVEVPCPVTNGGDGNNGGGDNSGGDNNGSTGGGDPNGSTDTTTNTNTDGVSSGDYDTGDTVLSSAPLGYTAGGIIVAIAAVLVTMGIVRSRRATVTG